MCCTVLSAADRDEDAIFDPNFSATASTRAHLPSSDYIIKPRGYFFRTLVKRIYRIAQSDRPPSLLTSIR